MNSKSRLLYLVVFLALAIGLSWLARYFVGNSLSEPSVSPANAFLSLMQARNYPEAYEYLHPDMQRSIGSTEELQAWASDSDLFPTSWTILSRDIAGNLVEIHLSTALPKRGAVELVLTMKRDTEGKWKIAAVQQKLVSP